MFTSMANRVLSPSPCGSDQCWSGGKVNICDISEITPIDPSRGQLACWLWTALLSKGSPFHWFRETSSAWFQESETSAPEKDNREQGKMQLIPSMGPNPILPSLNETSLHPASFLLLGIPGLEVLHLWLSIPTCLIYISALLGNSALLFLILLERNLHTPMFLLLAMLTGADLALSTSTVPKTLSVLWALSQEISFHGCLAQIFFIHVTFIAESTILLAMAFDRYVAICQPLCYPAILTTAVTGRMGLAALGRALCVMVPAVFLLERLPYCGHRRVPHTYCEQMGIARLACAPIRANIWYGLTTTLLSPGLDMMFIGTSYGLILRAVFQLPSRDAKLKALGTCGAHFCVILLFYLPALFSFFAHLFGQGIPCHVHVLLANLYVLLPPMLNPIIYGVKTKPIRERMVHLLSCVPAAGRGS
ncbi:olfactory receptor 52B2-like [Tachyglossus aculeatus]|uniref:olfactory receptor 52B2-like n=1 Tax=Tachyglossus aculeatus TaxID=9261 RepID=UPI0018F7453F|nr:olfactory receptor 52B2-like [Tachyglossus aculeatus]